MAVHVTVHLCLYQFPRCLDNSSDASFSSSPASSINSDHQYQHHRQISRSGESRGQHRIDCGNPDHSLPHSYTHPDLGRTPILGLHRPLNSTTAFRKKILKAWNGYLHSFPIFQARIRAWFESPSFACVAYFKKTLPITKHKIYLLCL